MKIQPLINEAAYSAILSNFRKEVRRSILKFNLWAARKKEIRSACILQENGQIVENGHSPVKSGRGGPRVGVGDFQKSENQALDQGSP
jgi:hypothetical protein